LVRAQRAHVVDCGPHRADELGGAQGPRLGRQLGDERDVVARLDFGVEVER
jgi:hypothetical protein